MEYADRMRHYKKTPPVSNGFRKRRENPGQRHKNIFNKVIGDNFPNLREKIHMKV